MFQYGESPRHETSIYHLPLTARQLCGLCVKLNSKCIPHQGRKETALPSTIHPFTSSPIHPLT